MNNETALTRALRARLAKRRPANITLDEQMALTEEIRGAVNHLERRKTTPNLRSASVQLRSSSKPA